MLVRVEFTKGSSIIFASRKEMNWQSGAFSYMKKYATEDNPPVGVCICIEKWVETSNYLWVEENEFQTLLDSEEKGRKYHMMEFISSIESVWNKVQVAYDGGLQFQKRQQRNNLRGRDKE
jgi:hypothetical protein